MGAVEITADTCECRRYISDMSDDEITAWNNYVKKANAEILKLDVIKTHSLTSYIKLNMICKVMRFFIILLLNRGMSHRGN